MGNMVCRTILTLNKKLSQVLQKFNNVLLVLVNNWHYECFFYLQLPWGLMFLWMYKLWSLWTWEVSETYLCLHPTEYASSFAICIEGTLNPYVGYKLQNVMVDGWWLMKAKYLCVLDFQWLDVARNRVFIC
jgi:hypothetical protein